MITANTRMRSPIAIAVMLAHITAAEVRPMKKVRELHHSPNGDRWFLIREPTGAVFIRHEANASSGGHIEHIELAEFLVAGHGPEHQELLRLIGTLVEEPSPVR
jgi:hypothetical protein